MAKLFTFCRHSLRRSSAIDSRELPSPLQPLLGEDACGEVLLPVPRQPSGNNFTLISCVNNNCPCLNYIHFYRFIRFYSPFEKVLVVRN